MIWMALEVVYCEYLCRLGLVATVVLLRTPGLEAVRAVDWFVATRHEGDHRLLTTHTTGRWMHGPLGPSCVATAARGRPASPSPARFIGPSAGRAATRLIGKALLLIVLLLASGKGKARATIPTG
jgi:hypothetical protein